MKRMLSAAALPRRPLPLLLTAITLGFFLHLFVSWGDASSHIRALTVGHNTTSLAIETEGYLERLVEDHGLTHKVEWAAWHVKPIQSLPRRDSVTTLQQQFQPRRPQVFDYDVPAGQGPVSNGDFKTLKLPAPQGAKPGEFDASGYLFGVSTTYDRLMENDRHIVKGWQWWLTNGNLTSNGAHIVVILDQASSNQISLVEALLQSLGIASMVYKTDETLSSAKRYLQIARELRAFSSALTAVGTYKKWFALLDDTLFFPGMEYLDQRLSSYDAETAVYIGLPVEREDWKEQNGKISTSGGGTAFLSREGLNKFLSVSCAEPEESGPPYHSQRWGGMLHECLTTKGGMKMHVLPALYSPQADSNNTGTELYEAGGRPLALYNRVKGLNMNEAYLMSDECGEACFMQRYMFSDGWVLVNGVSISQYQYKMALEGVHQQKPELSSHLVYDNADGERIRLTGGGVRNVWRLLHASINDAGVVWQAFVRRAPRDDKSPDSGSQTQSDSVIVLIWDEVR